MSQTITTSNAFSGASRASSILRTGGAIVAGSLLVALGSHVSVPLFFTPVPMTLQPFAVLLLGLFMEPAAAFAALALFLIEGAAGLPVFTPQGLGGTLQLFGPTGGYLLSYPFAAALIGFLYQRFRNFPMALVSAAAGNILILSMGTLWLAAATHQSIAQTLSISAVPFLAGDALKVIVAAGLVTGWMRIRKSGASATR